MYWIFRKSIRSYADVIFVFKVAAFCALAMAPLVALEWATGRNPFVVMGTVMTRIREGRYRCQASFPHSIMLGVFWASFLPVFASLGITRAQEHLYWLAAGAAAFIVAATASSTPLVSLAAGVCLLAAFNWRRYGKQAAIGFCIIAAAMHVVMQAPVWHLLSRVGIIGGSTGWHRYYLVDQAIKHFREWAILGTRSTAHWGHHLFDITNQYVLEGVQGGFISLVLFIMLLIMAVKTMGRFSMSRIPRQQQWVAW
jgi:hypothetical protein